jgi:succinate dehydrogenase / fumarate reductase flavoprotein subunit
MGGLWMGFAKDEKTGGLKKGDPANMMTNVPGLYTMGEVSFAYHGANRLGANSLLSCIFDGLFGGSCIKNYITDVVKTAAADLPQSTFDTGVKLETDKQNALVNNTSGTENPYLLWQEMGKWMTDNCTVVRENDKLKKTLEQCEQWKDRVTKIKLSDTGMWTNQNLSFARATRDMVILAEAILKGALLRNESRGAHYKPAYPDRNDTDYLKTTIATYNAADNSAQITYGAVDTSLVVPRARTYGKVGAAAPATKPAATTTSAPAVAAPAASV